MTGGVVLGSQVIRVEQEAGRVAIQKHLDESLKAKKRQETSHEPGLEDKTYHSALQGASPFRRVAGKHLLSI